MRIVDVARGFVLCGSELVSSVVPVEASSPVCDGSSDGAREQPRGADPAGSVPGTGRTSASRLSQPYPACPTCYTRTPTRSAHRCSRPLSPPATRGPLLQLLTRVHQRSRLLCQPMVSHIIFIYFSLLS